MSFYKSRYFHTGTAAAVILALGLSLTGCKDKKAQPAASQNQITDTTGDSMTTMKAKLGALGAKIDDLHARAKEKSAEMSEDARERYNKSLTEMKYQYDKLKEKLDKAGGAGAENWEKVKSSIGSGYDNLKKAYDKSVSDWSDIWKK